MKKSRTLSFIFAQLITISCFFFGCATATERNELRLKPETDKKYLQITEGTAILGNGTHLHYLTSGDPKKPLLIFLHGFPEFSLCWQRQLEYFNKDFYVVAPDMRGFNLSSKPQDAASYASWNLTEDLWLLSLYLGKDIFTLVGHDWGGVIAWAFAMEYPRLLEKLVIINAPHPLVLRAVYNSRETEQPNGLFYIYFLTSLSVQDSVRVMKAHSFQNLKAAVLSQIGSSSLFFSELSPPALGSKTILDAYVEAWGQAGALEAQTNYYKTVSLPPAPLPSIINESKIIKIPTLVIWGMKDPILSSLNITSALLPQYVSHLKIIRIAEGGHLVHHEFPDRVNLALQDFFEARDKDH